MQKKKIFTALLVTLFFSRTVWAENSIKFLDKELIKQLNNGIYEVVTPKIESSKMEYDRKLPFEKMDFKERNEKYYSIGTAFFINEKELLTAGHVFSPMYFSLRKQFFIRDAAGKVYPVGKINKYSTIRDMLVFNLEQYPEKIRPLTFSGPLDVGDTVFSAGNALGEGISYRAGQVASFTDEREYGKWKDIRFSSPASPGNSGGPLLNLAGEVAGVIVSRANVGENYNVAVPISEFSNLTDKAEFQLRNVTVEIAGTDETVIKDWSFSLPLPAAVTEVAEKSQNSLDAFHKAIAAELTEKVKEKSFPLGPRFRDYLRNQPIFQGLAALVPDIDFKQWTAASYSMEKIPLSAVQNVHRGESLHFDFQAIVEKSPETPLKDFLDSPKMIMDTLLKAIPYYRSVGTEKVRINSFGEPEQKNVWNDRLGRKWTTSLWFSEHNNFFIASHCLAYPKGALCNVTVKSASILKLNYFDMVKEGSDEITIGYEGEVDDWVEYFSLGKERLPVYFEGAEMVREGSRLQMKLKDFQIDFSNPKISGKSSLHLHLGYANELLLAEDLVRFEIFPQKGSPAHYRIQPFFAPSPFSQENYTATWDEALHSTGEFSGKVINKGERRIIHKTATQTKKTLTAFDGQKIEKLFTVGCSYKTAAEEEGDIEQDCARFFQGVKFF
ncbi:MAG: Trypsin-like peptidase domain-containing protein [Candidatus Electronema aureum]|uniref:Trypsin-like peptidase domain-containing protein n=1 Tax=Candidatus Electronema aureum TaxID=2005002 RepID=A0A521G560_9BACT|nr:MAG: Trypsin-like peptidase domain-containing protein [Candidatus Electronema aureum]